MYLKPFRILKVRSIWKQLYKHVSWTWSYREKEEQTIEPKEKTNSAKKFDIGLWVGEGQLSTVEPSEVKYLQIKIIQNMIMLHMLQH